MLALEPDSGKASAITQVVSTIADASLTVVRSTDRLLEALRRGVPDLVLLPALLPWADEAQLIDALRSISDGRHLEVVVTPFEIAQETSDSEDDDTSEGWRRLLTKTTAPPKPAGCSVRAFSERVRWALHCVRLARLQRAKHIEWFGSGSIDAPGNRRAYRRFAPTDLPWLQTARLRGGGKLKLLDLSSGGALVRMETPLARDVEGLLELVGGQGPSVVPFRVIRWHPSSSNREFPYLGAFAFTKPFEFDNAVGPLALGDSDVVDDGVLAPFLRRPDGHQARGARLTRDQLPWLSSVNLPWGAEAALMNISKSGMLIETASKLAPGTTTQFHISGRDTDLSISAVVVRSEIGSVNTFGVKYLAAVRFENEFVFPREGDAVAPAPKMLARLLNEVLRDADRGGQASTGMKEMFAEEVRKLVRAREVAIARAPTPTDAGGESIYFTIPGGGGSSAVLQATFERDHVPTEAEFRCLRSAAALTTAVLELEHWE